MELTGAELLPSASARFTHGAAPLSWSDVHEPQLRGVVWARSERPIEHPFLEVHESSDRPRSHNAYAHEDARVALYASPREINTPPRTRPRANSWAYKEWHLSEAELPATPHDIWPRENPQYERIMRWSQVVTRNVEIMEAARAAGKPCRLDWRGLDDLGGMHGLFIHQDTKKPQYRDYTFDVAPFHRGEPGPIRPTAGRVDPRERCMWNLDKIYEECTVRGFPDLGHAHELWSTGLDDRARGARHTWLCLPLKSFWEPKNFDFVQKNMQGKRQRVPCKLSPQSKFPPTEPAYACPCGVNVRWCDEKQRFIKDMGGDRDVGPDGEPGWTPPRSGDPSPLSTNGRIQLESTRDFPAIEYMKVEDLVRYVAVLLAIKSTMHRSWELPEALKIFQWKTDFCAWYEQIPRAAANDWAQHQLVSSGGWETDWQLVFGGSSCVAGAQRTEGMACWVLKARVRETQQVMLLLALARHGLPIDGVEAAIGPLHYTESGAMDAPSSAEAPGLDHHGVLDVATLIPLLLWQEARVHVGDMPDWAAVGGMIDDTAAYGFSFFKGAFVRSAERLFREWNFEVADGQVGADRLVRKNKTECKEMHERMTLLGIQPDMLSQRLRAEPEKRARFDKALRELREAAPVGAQAKMSAPSAPPEGVAGEEEARVSDDEEEKEEESFGRWGSVEAVRRLKGQLQHTAVHIAPEIRAPLGATAGKLQTETAGVLHGRHTVCWVPAHAERELVMLADRGFAAQGAAFMPRQGLLGKGGRGRLYQWFDASGDRSEGADLHGAFRGGGVVMWLAGTDVALVSQIEFSHNARHTLDSTALEQYMGTEALLLGQETARTWRADCIQLGDNSSQVGGAKAGRMKAPVQRAALEARWRARDTWDDQILVEPVHVRRERNKPADWLTRHRLVMPNEEMGAASSAASELAQLVCTQLQRAVHLAWVPPAPGAPRRLTVLLRHAAVAGTRRVPLPHPPMPVRARGVWAQADAASSTGVRGASHKDGRGGDG